MNNAIQARHFQAPLKVHTIKLDSMPKVTLNVPHEKMALFIEAMAALGLSNDESMVVDFQIPDWQQKMLDERKKEIFSGKATFMSWEDFEKELANVGIK